MTDTSQSPSAEVAQLRNQLDELRAADPAPSLAEAKQRVAAAASDVAGGATEAVAAPIRRGVDRVRGAVAGARGTAARIGARTDGLSRRVRNRPFLALGAAVLAGYACGRIVR